MLLVPIINYSLELINNIKMIKKKLARIQMKQIIQ